jgi:hypothetical protein
VVCDPSPSSVSLEDGESLTRISLTHISELYWLVSHWGKVSLDPLLIVQVPGVVVEASELCITAGQSTSNQKLLNEWIYLFLLIDAVRRFTPMIDSRK